MAPPTTLTRPEATTSECRQLRAVGNDGLTDVERGEHAAAFRRGPGRQPGQRELADIAAWLRHKRAATQLA